MRRISFCFVAGIATFIGGLGLSGASPAKADILTFQYVHIGTGAVLDGTLTAKVSDTGADQVTVTMSSNMSSGFVSAWAFNLDPAFTDYAGLTHDAGAVTGGATLPNTIALGPANSVSVNGSAIAGFDIGFDWTGSNHGFDGVSSVTYVLKYTGSQTFDAMSFNALNSTGQWYSAAKVQAISPTGGSGEVGSVNPPVVPEPGSFVLMSLGGSVGLIGMWFRRRLRTANEVEV